MRRWICAWLVLAAPLAAQQPSSPRDTLAALRTDVAKQRASTTPDVALLRRYLDLWDALPAADRDANLRFGAYLACEILAADAHRRGQLDEAQRVLSAGLAVFQRDPDATRERTITRQLLDRLSMIGRPAPDLVGGTWLNADPPAGRFPLAGAVTLVEFTAHWCGPCKESYPGLTRLSAQYGARGLRVVLATRLYGYYGATTIMAPDDERAAVTRMFVDELRLPFPAVIADPRTGGSASGVSDANAEAFFVQPIPHFVLVDRGGIVRAIELGWDAADEARWAARIEPLLAR